MMVSNHRRALMLTTIVCLVSLLGVSAFGLAKLGIKEATERL
jgi:hypothetical protein